MLDNGTDVMYEHSEEWHWPTGESAVMKFVTVHQVRDGKITLWKDYWDMGALTNFAPPSWMEDFANADMSWVFDGTGADRFCADIGVKDGRIVEVRRRNGDDPGLDGDAAETLDATGRIVAPGFVDIHTHYDGQVSWDPLLE